MVMVPANHPIAAKTKISPSELTDHPFIAFADEAVETAVFSPLGLKPNIKYRVQSDAMTDKLVSEGMGIAFIYKLPVKNLPDTVTAVALSGNYSRTISIAYKKTNPLFDTITVFTEVTKEYLSMHYGQEELLF